jgi:hypothetical protein
MANGFTLVTEMGNVDGPNTTTAGTMTRNGISIAPLVGIESA